MQMRKIIIVFMLLFLLIPTYNIKASNIDNIAIPDFVKNEAKNEDYFKGDIVPKEYTKQKDRRIKSYSKNFYVAYAYAEKNKSSDKYPTLIKFDKLKKFVDFAEAKTYMNNIYAEYKNKNTSEYLKKAYGLVILNDDNKVVDMKIGRAYISSPGAMLILDDNYGSSSPYIVNNQEVFYYGAQNNENYKSSRCKIGISGITNYTSLDNLTLVPESVFSDLYLSGNSDTKKYKMGYYYVNSNRDLYHYVSVLNNPINSQRYENGEKSVLQSFIVDKAPSFMKTNTKYYSVDGVNFYTSKYLSSSSKVGTYYPYFTYLSYRTKTSYTKEDLDLRIKSYPSDSKLKNQGKTLIDVQNKYGINALMELSFANLESGYGTSSYAKNKNNLFGIAAYDENPDNAYSFPSASKCIEEHAYRHLSRAYFDANSDFRYYGSSPGNKKIGVNVKYASDPYHGEKIGGIAYTQDKNMGSKDYEKYTIGVTSKVTNVYQKPSLSSKVYYKLSNKQLSQPIGMPVVILSEEGEFYKIQTDMGVVDGDVHFQNLYNYNDSVAYVRKSDVSVVRKGKGNLEGGVTQKPVQTKAKLKISDLKISPSVSYGFTPGYGNKLRVQSKLYSNVKNAKAEVRVYDSKKKLVAKTSITKKNTGTTTEKIYWDGKATKGNAANYKEGGYVKRTSSGNKYYVKLILSTSDTKTETKLYSIKLYNKATRLYTNITNTKIKRKSTTVLSMKPNRPGTSMVRIYNSKNELVFREIFYYKKANVKNSVKFKGYGNYGKYNKKLLAKGSYKVKFTHGDYTYTYGKKIVLK